MGSLRVLSYIGIISSFYCGGKIVAHKFLCPRKTVACRCMLLYLVVLGPASRLIYCGVTSFVSKVSRKLMLTVAPEQPQATTDRAAKHTRMAGHIRDRTRGQTCSLHIKLSAVAVWLMYTATKLIHCAFEVILL